MFFYLKRIPGQAQLATAGDPGELPAAHRGELGLDKRKEMTTGWIETFFPDPLTQGLRVEYPKVEGLLCKNANDVRQKRYVLYY